MFFTLSEPIDFLDELLIDDDDEILVATFCYISGCHKINAWWLYRVVSNSDFSLIEFQRIMTTSFLKTYVDGVDIIVD